MLAPLLVVAVAFAVRMGYLLSLGDDPWVRHPIVDEIAYDRMARLLLAGRTGELLPFFRPPLWPSLLALAYAVFGSQFAVARVIAALLGALSVGAAYRLGRLVLGRAEALLGSLFLAVAGILVHLNTSALPTSLFLWLLLEAALQTVRTLHGRMDRKRALAAGGLWGLAALAYPVGLLPAAASMVWLGFGRDGGGRRGGWRALSAAALGLLVPLAAMTAVQGFGGAATPLPVNGGVNFYLGNRSGADGVAPVHPEYGADWTPGQVHRWAEAEAGRMMTPTEASRWYLRRAAREMAAKPAEAVERFGRKLVLVLGPTPLSNNGDLDFFRRQRPLLRVLMVVGWGFLLPLGLVGAFIAVRRGGASRYLTVLAGLLILVPVVFFVTSRYRAAALPFLALLAAPAVAALFRGGLSLRKRTGPLLAGALLAVALAFAQDPFLPASNPAYGYLVQGLLEERDGDPRQAEQAYRRALALSPEDSHARRALAFLVLDEGRPEEAEALFRTLVVQNPGAAVLRGLGLSLRAQNRHDEALAALERAMRISPGDRRLRALYAEELGEQGLRAAERDNWQASLEWFTAARGNDSSNPFFPFGQATALWSLGRREQAARMMDSLYVANPDFPPAVSWIEHGWRP